MAQPLPKSSVAPAATKNTHLETDVSARNWLAVLSLSLGTFALVTSELLPIGLLPKIAADLGVGEGTAGLSVTAPGIVAAIATPLLVTGSGRLDRRVLVLLLSLVLLASNLIVAVSTTLPILLAGRTLLGIGVGGFWAIGAAIAGRLAPAAGGRATALVFAGISGGTVIGLPAGTYLSSVFGWRGAFLAAAGLCALCIIAQGILIPKLPPQGSVSLRALPAFIRSPRVRLGLVLVALAISGQFAAYTYIVPYLKAAGANQAAISGALLGYGVAGLVGNQLAGEFAQRSVQTLLAAIGFVLGVTMLVAAALGHTPIPAIAMVLLWGFAFGGVPVTLQIYMFKAAPDSQESAGAVFVSTFQFALAVGAWIGGIAVDSAGLSAAILFGGAIVLGMGAVTVASGIRSRN